MDSRYIDLLVWVAAKLSDLSNSVFIHAVKLAKAQDSNNPTTAAASSYKPIAKPQPPPEPSPKKPEPELLPAFFNGEGKAIPLSFEALPDELIFRTMFERKYGKNGTCPITVGGQTRTFSCEALYELLKQIKNSEDPSPMFRGVYGSVMSVVMHAHGETIGDDKLN